jgi:hypothetical protein
MKNGAKYFRVVPRNQYYRLTHTPSGDYVQRYLCDFLTRKDAIECRNKILEAAPDWNWGDPGLFQEMPCAVFDKVWAAIYDTRPNMTKI